jgi:hypothetical protein
MQDYRQRFPATTVSDDGMLSFNIADYQVRLFWNKVAAPNERGCMLWAASRNKDGYGSFGLRGRSIRAHRLAYFLGKGPIDTRLIVCHTCDTPACVSPDHLYLGTRQDNSNDCKARNRVAFWVGEEHPRALLTESDVIRIMDMLQSRTAPDIASEFGVEKTTISNIKRGVSWKHLPRPQHLIKKQHGADA